MRFLFTLAAATLLSAGPNDSFLIRNTTVYPVTGPKQDAVSVLVLDGKIAEIGAKVTIPKGLKIRTIEGKGLSVYPGLIDAASQVGMAEIASIRETVDTTEIGDFNPQLRALVAINPESEHIPVTRANGITTTLVVPGSLSAGGGGGGGRGGGGGGIIGGQAALIHLAGWTWEEMNVERTAAIALRMPTLRNVNFNLETGQVTRGTAGADARRAFDQEIKKIRDFFEQARAYRLARQSNQPGLKADLKFDAMEPVLEGKVPLFVIAPHEREIKEAIDLATREKVRIIVAGVRKAGAQAAALAKNNIPVVLGTTLELPEAEDDPYDAPFTFPAELHKAGVKFCFGSFGTQFARNLPYEAAQAVAFGLPHEEGLKAVTINAAEIFGVADRMGSVEKGKWADIIVTDGDPLEVKTQVKMMFVKGQEVELDSKHTRLYEKYLSRP